jgi:mannose-6-phosphate isomerase-like protein (cupin superfamily)
MDHYTEKRPWGSFTVLCVGPDYKVKQEMVSPGQRLSYQFHHHRQEHWMVVEGVATITLEGKELVLEVGQTIDIPLKAKHRMANTGTIPMAIIEIQRGSYVGEDDIVRLEDDFGRS